LVPILQKMEVEVEKEKENGENKRDFPEIPIEHLVISGGCIWGFYEYGALKELHESGFWNINNIKSMYGTSIGSIVAVILALKIDFETIDNYVIHRPWYELWQNNSYNALETYNECGVFHKNVLYEFFSPLFKSCDIELNVNMQEFYEKTGIEIHIFVTELNMFEPIDISYKTHPNWQVVDALYSSSTIPIIFSPIIQNDKCYIDGGFFNNYPVRKCLENNMDNKDSILGISIGQSLEHDQDNQFVTAESSFLDFTCVLLNRIIKNILFSTEDIGILKYEICFYTQVTTLQYIYKVVSSKEERKSLISMGEEKAMEYFQKWNLENEE